jgi:hypothetical protein
MQWDHPAVPDRVGDAGRMMTANVWRGFTFTLRDVASP